MQPEQPQHLSGTHTQKYLKLIYAHDIWNSTIKPDL